MHHKVRAFVSGVKKKFPDNFINCDVLDVGSLDINGTLRDMFDGGTYTGVDLQYGPGVDIICDVNYYNPGMLYNTIISTEMLEHDITWKKSLQKMYDLLKPGGLLICTAAGIGRSEHGTHRTDEYSSPFTLDYYRNIDSQDVWSVLPGAVIEEDIKRLDIRFYIIKT